MCALAVLSFASSGTAYAQFALCPPVAGLPYGLNALKFPAAWNKTCGTAYVAIVDHGIQLGHASLLSETSGNVRTHLSRDCTHVPRDVAIGPAGSDARCATSGVTFDSLDAPVTVATLEEPVTPGRGHGTHVAGIIGARPGGNIVGGCRNCSLLLFVRRDDRMSDPNDPGSFTLAGKREAP
ncbi:MAG TPA: S8 family serine peptidase [Kofleriaceae bacterium]